MMNEEQDILNVKETARLLGMSIQGVYHMVFLGTIPHYKIGKRLRFSRKKLSNWLSKKEFNDHFDPRGGK